MRNTYVNTLYKQLLYEQLINDIAVHVKYAINEAYDNQLLESYDIKQLLNTILDNAISESKILILKINKLLVYIIKRLQETNQYKKADKIIKEYKLKVIDYINEHKKITPRRLFKILIAVLTIYGGVSLIYDCKSLINQINNSEGSIEYVEIPDTIDLITDNDFKEIENDSILLTLIGSTPYLTYVDNGEKINFQSSKNARNFIKGHENLLLYPYYATAEEENKGLVTIGYGHVVLKTDGELYTQVLKLKRQGKIKRSFIRSNGKSILNPNHCYEIITKQQAEELFKNDIKIAEQRAINSVKEFDTDNDVKYYILYNQDMMDALTSLCYNAGFLKQHKYRFIHMGLNKCRYDKENNCINQSDYDKTCKLFTALKLNHSRRVNEYELFLKNANNSFKSI